MECQAFSSGSCSPKPHNLEAASAGEREGGVRGVRRVKYVKGVRRVML